MIGRLQRQLTLWAEHGLLSAEQADAIQDFERERNKKRSHRGFALTGITAILIGVLSLVASNWSQIPDLVKLMTHILLNIAVAFAVINMNISTPRGVVIRDLCVTALFGLTLTLIALIGQIYQLHGDLSLTVTLWTICCAPFIWYWGRGIIAITPWLVALIVSIFMMLDYAPNELRIFALLIVFSIPLLLILVSTIDLIKIHRPIFSVAFLRYGMGLLGIITVLSTAFFYTLPDDMMFGYYAIFIWLCSSCALYKDKDLQIFVFVSGLICVSSLFIGFYIPYAAFSILNAVLAAIMFVGYFGFLAWFGARTQNHSLVDWSIRFIILRFVIVYFEVFGSLAATVLILLTLKNLNRIMVFGRSLVKGGSL